MSRNLHTPPSLTFACRGPSGVPKKQRNRVAVMDAHASPPPFAMNYGGASGNQLADFLPQPLDFRLL